MARFCARVRQMTRRRRRSRCATFTRTRPSAASRGRSTPSQPAERRRSRRCRSGIARAISPITPPASRRRAAYAVFGGLLVAASFASLNWIYAAVDSPRRSLRPGACRGGRLVLRPYRARGRGEVGADRPGEGGRDPRLELCLLPLLGGEARGALGARRTLSPARRSSTSICACSARRSAATP